MLGFGYCLIPGLLGGDAVPIEPLILPPSAPLSNGKLELSVVGPLGGIVKGPRFSSGFAPLLRVFFAHRMIRAKRVTTSTATGILIPSITPRLRDFFGEAEEVDEGPDEVIDEGSDGETAAVVLVPSGTV
jgi:hypothetical protein